MMTWFHPDRWFWLRLLVAGVISVGLGLGIEYVLPMPWSLLVGLVAGVTLGLAVGMMRWPAKREVHETWYECVIAGCDRPAAPSDGPFCAEHGWDDVEREMKLL